MERGQYQDASYNLSGYKRIWFKWTMTAATTFTVNRSQELLRVNPIVRTGVGIYDIFPLSPPGVELIDWYFDAIEVTPSNTSANSGKATVVNSLIASNKVTVTFRINSTQAAADFATGDIIYGWLGIQTVFNPGQ
jgi:hypothetical protein